MHYLTAVNTFSMSNGQALLYFVAWVIVAFFALFWLRALGARLPASLRAHLVMSVVGGIAAGWIWYITIIGIRVPLG